jgi:F-type H+-transporting ATPase subunit epsilon
MKLQIISPSKVAYSNEITRVLVPGTKGSFEILKNHAPIISTLNKGVISIIDEKGSKINFEMDGGLIECNANEIVILLCTDAILQKS